MAAVRCVVDFILLHLRYRKASILPGFPFVAPNLVCGALLNARIDVVHARIHLDNSQSEGSTHSKEGRYHREYIYL